MGGTVAMYVPLTLTPKDTWEDAAQAILNSNPIVLDSRGQAVIYGTGSYRQIVSDSLGNLIYDAEIADFQESVFGPQDQISASTTTDLGSVASNNVLINGTTTINSFGTSASLASPIYFLTFSGVLTLTYNATSMVLPGGANITTGAGDGAMVEVTNASAGYWKMIAYFSQAASGALGTAASKNTGTSGGTVPLLNGSTNVWSGINRYSAQTYGDEQTLAVTANASTPDFATGNYFLSTITAAYTLNNPVNLQAGQSGLFRISQGAGSLTIVWGTAYKAAGGIATVNLSGINGAVDYFAFYAHSSSEVVITPLLNVS